jgi:DNA-binding LytR/AlgR family response regulator
VDAIARLERGGGQWQLMLADGPTLTVGRAYRPALRIHLGF